MKFRINRRLLPIAFGLFAALLGFNHAFAADVTIAPGQSCNSAGCHEQFGKGKYVHAAMEDGDCSSCHEQQDDEHAFEYPEEDDELCLACHDAFDQKKNQHAALEEGCTSCHNPHESDSRHLLEAESVDELCSLCHDAFDQKMNRHDALDDGCTSCHAPHESDSQYLLEAESLDELCFTCHDDSIISRDWAHAPAEGGECTSCHSPHESNSGSLLAKASPDVCFECHSDLEESLEGNSSIHAAAVDDCLNCHDPHSGNREYLITEDVPRLCFECHDDIEELLASSAVKHGVVDQGKACLNCHNPHVSGNDTLLKVGKEELCYSCHDRLIETATDELEDIKTLVEKSEYKHGPVNDDDCMSCHDPHAAANFRLLKARYPSRYYLPFTFKDYELCFECHDKAFILNEETEWLTSFRDGARNLHFLHVNRKVKGRKCTNCHDIHASPNAEHIRETTMFGAWEMDIIFEKTETGGSCDPGCHKYEAYDTKKPVDKEWQPTNWDEEVHFK
jgi:predicted CXXCH cytochrome family protein